MAAAPDENLLKRKHHVSFAEDEPTTTSPSEALIGGMHPDRLAALQEQAGEPEATRAAKKQKVKTDAQKRYLKKKVNKRKKVLKATKAAAPKMPKDAFEASPDDVLPAIGIPAPVVIGDLPKPSATLALKALEAAAIPPEDETPERLKERRRLEKKAKRETRRAEEAVEAEREEERTRLQREKEEKEARKAEKRTKRKAAEKKDTEHVPEASAPQGHDADSEMDAEPQAGPSIARSPSPSTSIQAEFEGMHPFPLPTGPAKPDATLLNAQGMPTALKDAQLIDESLRLGLKELRVLGRSRKGKEREVLDQGLDEAILEKLRKLGIDEFFAVQAALLPELANLPLTPPPSEFLHDYLVSAPTGSGKTLAYGIPLVQVLSKRVVTRLRALIILPTRELVGQVRETLGQLAKGTGLKIGVATGQQSFPQEQGALIDNLKDELLGGSSKVDILIATPGRLIDHLQGTRNFSFQHVRFLVVDEADRLLTQSFQGWLAEVLEHLKPSKPENAAGAVNQDIVASSWYPELCMNGQTWEGSIPLEHSCQKLLFSATLTRDPSKIAALRLRNPRYIIVRRDVEGDTVGAGDLTSGQFAIPAGLSENMVIMPPELKPLNLLYLLHAPIYSVRSALCFTKSTDSAERLLRLLSFFEDAFVGSSRKIVVRGYTSELGVGERGKLLGDFKEGKIDLLVCSDLIARGIDLPSVSHVISYDVPVDMRKYVHRVGRTARAGREGVAWSLVEKQEAHHFKEMLSSANHLQKVKKVKLKDADFEPYQESYKIARSRLKETYAKA